MNCSNSKLILGFPARGKKKLGIISINIVRDTVQESVMNAYGNSLFLGVVNQT
jgi:hypothetical protein